MKKAKGLNFTFDFGFIGGQKGVLRPQGNGTCFYAGATSRLDKTSGGGRLEPLNIRKKLLTLRTNTSSQHKLHVPGWDKGTPRNFID